MKEKKALVIILLLFVILLGAAGVLYSRLGGTADRETLVTVPAPTAEPVSADTPEEEAAPEVTPPPAPDFTVYDAEGNAVRLSDFKGKPVVLNFWASWCGPCKSEMPDFNEVWQEYGDDVQFMMINMTDGYQETMEKASAYMEGQGFDFPVYYDSEQNAAVVYGVMSIPTTFLIDAEGRAVGWAAGAIAGDVLRDAIRTMMERS
ncbi:MAG: TlpA family protein disulfide reductase [Ruminococcaceae bacterium]|nr:TlpA family protein disulfide reductase [Oscillospiraceae bacterium]